MTFLLFETYLETFFVIFSFIYINVILLKDARFDYLCEKYKPGSKVPAYLNVVDIAGLVSGAHEGKGLGNAFLSHIKACDGIYHMLRIFDDEEIIHVEGEVDPIRDIGIINDELRMKDLEYAERIAKDVETKYLKANDKTLKGS